MSTWIVWALAFILLHVFGSVVVISTGGRRSESSDDSLVRLRLAVVFLVIEVALFVTGIMVLK